MGKSPIHAAAARITKALSEMDIPFSVAGALAVNVHGHMRTTEDVNILLTAEGLERFKKRWVGRAVPGLQGAAGYGSSSEHRRDPDR